MKRYEREVGSSPLARGTPPAFETSVFPCGLIPARAGNTQRRANLPRAHGAHPRSRGEHKTATPRSAASEGSSPLARGTLRRTSFPKKFFGLIPARAGNTPGAPNGWRTRRAHPRSRGEHSPGISGIMPRPGSSPLARGTLLGTCWCVRMTGLIPARAGNTLSGRRWGLSNRAHPRSRGEHRAPAEALTAARGSSPLARGTQGCRACS